MLRTAGFTVLTLVVAVLAAGLDYSLAAKGQENYSLEDHLKIRMDSIAALKAAEGTLATTFPKAPDGWKSREGKIDDSYLVIGKSPTDAELQMQAEMEDKVAATIPGYDTARRFYENGDKMVAAEVNYIPANARATQGAGFFRSIMALLDRQSSTEPDLSPEGMTFQRYTGQGFEDVLYLHATLDDRLVVSFVTNLDAAGAKAFLSGLDVSKLNLLLTADPTLDLPLLASDPASEGQICVRKGGVRSCQTATN